MKNIKHILPILLVGFLFSSCEDILDLKPLSSPTDETFFSTETELQLGIDGVYGAAGLRDMMPEGLPMQVYMETMLTDNGIYRITDEWGGLQALSKSEQVASSGFSNIYNPLYKGIGRANNLLQNMHRAEDVVTEAKFNDFKAQALTLRAYFYHMLTFYFGDVPYLDFLPSAPEEGYIERSPKETVVNSILADLDQAVTLLDPSLSGVKDRVTLPVIYGLKARIALYNNRFDVAAEAADNAIAAAEANGYSLNADYGQLFTLEGETSSEIMMRFPFAENFKKTEYLRRFGSRYGSYSQSGPTQNLIDAYPTVNGLPIDEDPAYDPKNPWDNRDPRLRASVVLPQDLWAGRIFESHPDSLKSTKFEDGKASRELNRNCRSAHWPAFLTGYLWRKYVDEAGHAERLTSSDQDVYMMRLGEMYLIKAEAEIERDGGNLQEAADALNVLRQRAWKSETNYPQVAVGSREQMRKTLRMERRVELAMEGFRYDDLVRWRLLDQVRAIPFIGRVLNLTTAVTVPSIDGNGLVTYPNKSEYDDWRYTINADGVVNPTGNVARYEGNWHNAWNRDFNPDRDYLLPIPQREIDLYEAAGLTLTQNPRY